MCLCVTGHVECTFEEGSRVLHRSGLLQQRPASHAPSTCDVRWDANARTRSHRSPHTETLPRFKARVAFRFRPRRVVMGSDSLNCYKPQCGAGVKWHMLLRGEGGRPWETERQVKQSLQPWLVLSPSNEKDSLSPGPASVSCLGTDARYLSICYSTTHQHQHTLTFSFPPWLSVSVTQTYTSTQPHTLHFDLQANSDKPISQVCWREIKENIFFHSFGHCVHQLWQHYAALLQQSQKGQERKASRQSDGLQRYGNR